MFGIACQFLFDPYNSVVQTKVIPCLLRLRDSRNTEVAERAREALALVGYAEPVHGRGINVLCLDGGGTKYGLLYKYQ